MGTRTQLTCAWCGIPAIVLAIAGFLLAGFLPPPQASAHAREVAALYGGDTTAIRLGMLLAFVAFGFLGPFIAVITIQMLRIEGRNPVLAFTQLVSGGTVWVFLSVPVLLMTVAAFRPDRPPEIIQAINDLAWVLLVMPISPFVVQDVAIAVAVMKDRSPDPVFPRWVAYLNLWVAFVFLPAGLLTFFQTGAFAWHGLLSFWIPLAAFATWLIVMSVMAGRAVRQQARLERAEPAAA